MRWRFRIGRKQLTEMKDKNKMNKKKACSSGWDVNVLDVAKSLEFYF